MITPLSPRILRGDVVSRALWTDLRRTIRRSLSRFISIAALMLVGVFALVGLKATGPDMRATAQDLYDRSNLADVTVTAPLGLDQEDCDLIASAPGIRDVQFGHSEDVLFTGSTTVMRVMSLPQSGSESHPSATGEGGSSELSRPRIIDGRLPETRTEIALDTRFSEDHSIGDTLSVERPLTSKEQQLSDGNFDDIAVGDLLDEHTFTITGFIQSAEYTSNQHMGRSPIGTGQLSGIAFVLPEVFDTDIAQIARVSYTDTLGLDAYADDYLSLIDQHRDALTDLLGPRPPERLATITATPQKDIDDSLADLAQARDDLATAQDQLADAHDQLARIPAPLDPQRAQREAALAQKQQEIDDAQADVDKNAQELADAQANLDAMEEPNYTVEDRYDNPAYVIFGDFADRMDVMAALFSTIAFAVALMVGLFTMTRMVQEERTISGTYSALGYSPRTVVMRYVIYGCSAAITGAIPGVILGHLVLPPVVFSAYASGFIFPEIIQSFHPVLSVVATLIALTTITLIAVIVARRELAEIPADLLRPKAPKPGTRVLLERITPLWKRMSFIQKVAARNLFRYKGRGIMTVLGIAGCVSLMISGVGLKDSLTGIVHRQYDQIVLYDVVALEDPNPPSNKDDSATDSTITQAIAEIPHVAQSARVHTEAMTTHAGSHDATQDINLMTPPVGGLDFGDFVRLSDSKTGEALSLEEADDVHGGGVVISQKLGSLLGVGPGDDITLSDQHNVEHTMRVAALTDMYVEHYVFMSDSVYASVFGHLPEPNSRLITLNDASASASSHAKVDPAVANDVSAALLNIDGIVSVIQVSSISSTIDAFMGGLNTVIIVMIMVAIALTVIITFNLTNINVSERIRELSTIKVLGFYPFEVTMYIYRETSVLTAAGVLAGWGLGAWLHRFMIGVLPPDNVMMDPTLRAGNMIFSMVLTLVISVGVMAIFDVKLRKVNMLDALKSVE